MCGELKWTGRVVLTVVAMVLTVAGGACAKVIYVDDDAPPGGDGSSWATAYPFLQDALTEAAATEETVEIRIARGIYRPDRDAANPNGMGDRDASFVLTSDLTLAGGYGGVGATDPDVRDIQAYETILSGDLAGDDVAVADPCDLENESSRAENSYHVIENERNASAVCLSGLRVSGGYADGRQRENLPDTAQGGGFYAEYLTDLEIDCCTFKGNWAISDGGAILLAFCTNVTITGARLIENAATSGGAGAFGSNLVVMVDCQISDNYAASQGGGLYAGSNDILMTHCRFQGNVGGGQGGGVYVTTHTQARASFVDCLIVENVSNWGGGVHTDHVTCTFDDSTFLRNRTVTYGGGIYVGYKGSASLKGCLLCGNEAEDGGGLAADGFETLTVQNTTLHGNRATRGTEMTCPKTRHSYFATVEIANSIISGVENSFQLEQKESAVSVAHSCIVGGLDSVVDPNGNAIWGPGNLEGEPCFADPGYWDANGTPDDPNDDFFVEGDYHLRSEAGRWDPDSESWVQDGVTSPCIDAGDPNSPIGYEPFPNGGVINLGAYGGTAEASKSYFGQPLCKTPIAGDINGDCKVDLKDIAILLSHWLQMGELTEEPPAEGDDIPVPPIR